MSDELGFRRYLIATRDKALDVVDQAHISGEARNLLKDFIEISKQCEKLLDARSEAGGDQRILQKRHEQLKTEHRELQNKQAKIADIVSTEVAPIIRSLTSDATFIAEKAKGLEAGLQKEMIDTSVRLKLSVRKIIEVFSKL